MSIKKHIPNTLTLLNLFCGSIAIKFAVNGQLSLAGALMMLSLVFDFFDGFAARLLGVSPRTYQGWESGRFSAPSTIEQQIKSLSDVKTLYAHWKKLAHSIERAADPEADETQIGALAGKHEQLLLKLFPFLKESA